MAQAQRRRHGILEDMRKQWMKHLFVWCGLAYLLVFSIIPMTGILVAFKEYSIKTGFSGIFTAPFVGLKYFREFLTDRKLVSLLTNTLAISFLKLLFSFPISVLFAVMISEMRGKVFKRVVQTVSYLPHFISWVIVSGLLFSFLSNGGVVNTLMVSLGIFSEPKPFLTSPDYYWGLAVASEIWKETGWSAIIFLAAISGIDPTQYESAQIDGAGRLQRIWYITLPAIKGTMAVILVLSIGSLLSGANFEQSLLLGNSMNVSKSEILQVYVYKSGLSDGRYSFAAAVGFFQSVVSMVLVVGGNWLSRKLSGTGLY